MGLDTALYLLYGSVILGGVTGILNCAVIYITNSTTYKNKVEYNTRKLKNEKKYCNSSCNYCSLYGCL